MRTSVPCFHSLQGSKFRENQRQQTATFQINKTFWGNRRKNNLIQFVRNTFTGDDFNPFLIPAKRFESIIVNVKAQLRSKTDATHHAQRIIAESDIRVKRSADCLFLPILHASERVYQFAETCFIETYSKSIDREITTVLIVFQRTVFNNRFARIPLIRLLTRTYKLYFRTSVFYLCCSEILENRNMSTTSQLFSKGFRHCNSTSYNYYIYIFRGTLQKNITNVATYHITLHAERIGRFGYLSEDGFAKMLLQFLLSQLYHSF